MKYLHHVGADMSAKDILDAADRTVVFMAKIAEAKSGMTVTPETRDRAAKMLLANRLSELSNARKVQQPCNRKD